MNSQKVTKGSFLSFRRKSESRRRSGESRYPDKKNWIPGQARNDKRGESRLFTSSSNLKSTIKTDEALDPKIDPPGDASQYFFCTYGAFRRLG